MKSIIKAGLTGLSLVALLAGCSSEGGQGKNAVGNNPVGTEAVTGAIASSESNLTQALKDSIAYMYSEEKLAKEVYLAIYAYQDVTQLEKIAENSEVKHIEAVNQLAQKYDLNITLYPDTDIPYNVSDVEKLASGEYPIQHIQELYDMLYDRGIVSQQAALEVGCIVEVTDINDLDTYIAEAVTSNAADVQTVFEWLRDGSYNHYWAFNSGLVVMGVSTGCCSLGVIDGVDYCHPEYPQN